MFPWQYWVAWIVIIIMMIMFAVVAFWPGDEDEKSRSESHNRNHWEKLIDKYYQKRKRAGLQ